MLKFLFFHKINCSRIGFSIANPDDPNMMDIYGFDNNVYNTNKEFLEM
jgi:hypothetical protein